MQTEILFPIHESENNSESQNYLEKNRRKFSKKCTKVIELLMNGIELTVLSAHADYGISSLPRRLKDCKDNGVHISDRWSDEGEYKIWYMTQLDKNSNSHLGS